ncbi:MAG: DUF2007 domain-containing protein [Clostridia bacterium]|nr:DUF2007 domain-containing protein [Clostridia bacterium]
MDRLFGFDKVSAHPDNFELLTTVTDNVQLTIIESILKGAKIPYFSKDRGSGSAVKVIAGYSLFGADIFVMKDDIEKARELIRPLSEEELEAIANAEDGEDSEEL